MKSGIIRRWTLSVFLVFALSLLSVATISCLMIKNNYYETARKIISAQTNDLSTVNLSVKGYGDSPEDEAAKAEEFHRLAQIFVDSFTEKSRMELWVIDAKSNVVVSSTGLKVDGKVEAEDYKNAKASSTGHAEWIGRNENGEKVMAHTIVLNASEGAAVRYIVSLQAVDEQLASMALVIFGSVTFFIVLLMILGYFFITSLAKSIKEVNITAKKFGDGDFDAQLEAYRHNDEIGELYHTFNSMTKDISQADRLKNDFISTVSHELRTPLTASKGWGETLLQVGDTDPELSKKGMQVIINEAGRLTGMVEELLDFSRMERGTMVLQTKKIDVLAELDETVFAYRDRAVRAGIELIYNAPHFAAPMTADPDRIKQVFLNILDNSIKYTNQNGTVIILAEFKDDNMLEIIFSDNGCGIPEEDLPRIKEKFFKSNNTVRGSGIGLAVADEIVRLHNGELKINSKLGEGTTVTIVLPVDSAPTQQEERGLVDEQE